MPRDWDASAYQRISAPLEAMGRDVLARLELRGDETVLDAGCGTGRVTAALVEQLPRGRVIAVDGSPAMVEEARERLPASVDVRVADLLELELDAPVDHVLSTATFHWILDHDRLFARLLAALKPGGRLVAQCGGAGNVADVLEVTRRIGDEPRFAEYLGGWPGPWRFASAEETAGKLTAAGFEDVRTWLFDLPVTPDEPRTYMGTVMLGSHLERLPAALHDEFIAAVLGELAEPLTVNYVRLNIDAVRGRSSSA
jgi:trans-aconitate 2-methyltransferase